MRKLNLVVNAGSWSVSVRRDYFLAEHLGLGLIPSGKGTTTLTNWES